MTDPAPSQPCVFDIVVLTDTRFPGGSSSSLAEEIRVAARAGYRIGIVHLASPRLGPSAVVHPGLRDLVERGVAELVLPGQVVDATLAVVKHPTVFSSSLDGVLPVRAERIIVTVGQVPRDDAGRYYDPVQVDANIERALGGRATWWPVSEVVRGTLTCVELADDNWDEIIDVERWRRVSMQLSTTDGDREANEPSSPSLAEGERPVVIGRHSRPDPMKWPGVREELTAAYPIDGSVEVRVLGGADPATELLGETPESWTVLPFGAQDPAVFLAGLDALVYYHHRDMVEAFGRTVLEALAVGIPVVVDPCIQSTFGDACLYAEPVDAIATIRQLLADPDALEQQRVTTDRVLHERFSHDAYTRRLERLIGPPAERSIGPPSPAAPLWDLIPPGQRESQSVELIVALGETTDEIADLLARLDAHRRRLPGFIPIVAMTCTRPADATVLGIETKVLTSRRKHADEAEQWHDYAHRRIRQIAATYDVDDIAAANPRHPDAWIALQQRRRRSSDRSTRG